MASKGGVNGTAVFVAVVGSILVWSGIKDKKISWIVRDLIAGKDPNTDPMTIGQDSAFQGSVSSGDSGLGNLLIPPGTPGSGVTVGPAPAPQTTTAAHNQAIAKPLAAQMGWTGDQWNALVKLWNQESGWSNTAVNPSSGATGIPQALPSTKMPLLAQAPSFDALTQILWGLAYIKGRYHNPINAWAHELSHGWY